MKHLQHIKGKFVVRVVVPPELRALNKRELRDWIGADKKAAERNATAVIARSYAQIDAARAKLIAEIASAAVTIMLPRVMVS